MYESFLLFVGTTSKVEYPHSVPEGKRSAAITIYNAAKWIDQIIEIRAMMLNKMNFTARCRRPNLKMHGYKVGSLSLVYIYVRTLT